MTGAQFGTFILGLVVVAIVAAIVVWLLHWLYLRSSKERAFVRTGLGGQKVVLDGGAFVLPILHEVIPVNMYFDRPVPQQRIGVVDHIAFTAKGLKETKARFDAAGVAYELRRQRDAGTWQLFCHDPNGAKVELDFDPSETP